MYCVAPPNPHFAHPFHTVSELALHAQMLKTAAPEPFAPFDSYQEHYDVFGLQFAANQLFRLVAGAEELFQRLLGGELLPAGDQQQIAQWLTLKAECAECLGEAGETRRSLARIDEELEASSDEASSEDEAKEGGVRDRVAALMAQFRAGTDALVAGANAAARPRGEFHRKGARGRRGSVRSPEELQRLGEDGEKATPWLAEMNSKNLRKNLKKIVTALDLNEKKIADSATSMADKEKLIVMLLEHKETKSRAHGKIEQNYQLLLKEYELLKDKLNQVKGQRNNVLEKKYQSEIETLEEKLQVCETLKNITDDGEKLLKLEKSLQATKKNLDKLKKCRTEMEEYRTQYEKQIREEKIRVFKSQSSTKSVGKRTPTDCNKIVALLKKSNDTFSSNQSLNNEELACLRHEIRNLRQTREFLLKQRQEITSKSQNHQLLNESDERELLQFEEAVEAIDLIIEYKNTLICGHQQYDRVLEEPSDRMLMERFLKLSENELRILLHRYFEKIIDLRGSSKKLEIEIVDIENQHDKLAYKVQNLSQTLQLVRSEAERRIVSLQQQHEDKLYLVLRNLASDKSLIAKFTRFRDAVPRQGLAVLPKPGTSDTKVTVDKNKLFLQKPKKN